ncbi:hypothetical protein M409DRAFT_26536 [Zasmidium cellare ATCC 36951]|uniref:SMP-30/Gluconolactonase/LRE-like region domain-containing protein n=1 Tax=Zasmidium cellare ATCC 36951 TaxID=1080233 RepID=A0A6A6CA34_ZASCE|nr:uncharacterized protein M409DRAFT_26536 [Zasmidium cellare ATCC 36951]KAF2163090.1 hypothetical protein M409DRAFT_26536 [Zasmidium cellare ATCC 36951]
MWRAQQFLNTCLCIISSTCSVNSYHIPFHGNCPTQLVYEYPSDGTWFENIAVRSNGDLLLTSLNHPAGLSTLSPFGNSPPKQIVTSADLGYLNSTLGITETEEDIFYLVAANYSLAERTVGTQSGTNALFRAQFGGYGDNRPEVRLVKQFGNEVRSLNGLTKFNDTLLLAADSVLGAIWAIDVPSGEYYKLVEDDLLAAPDPESPGFKEGINGVRFSPHKFGKGGVAYFTNSQKYLFGKIELDGNAHVLGPAEWIANSIAERGVKAKLDDFALDAHGNAWIATEAGNSVQLVTTRQGQVKVVAGDVNSTEIGEPTSTAFGRTERDRGVLYVATSGGLAFPVWKDGREERVGAQVVALDTDRCGR